MCGWLPAPGETRGNKVFGPERRKGLDTGVPQAVPCAPEGEARPQPALSHQKPKRQSAVLPSALEDVPGLRPQGCGPPKPNHHQAGSISEQTYYRWRKEYGGLKLN